MNKNFEGTRAALDRIDAELQNLANAHADFAVRAAVVTGKLVTACAAGIAYLRSARGIPRDRRFDQVMEIMTEAIGFYRADQPGDRAAEESAPMLPTEAPCTHERAVRIAGTRHYWCAGCGCLSTDESLREWLVPGTQYALNKAAAGERL